MCSWLSALFGKSGVERPSPQDWVGDDGITILNASVMVDLTRLNVHLDNPPAVWIPPIPDTNSMDGAFDYGHNNILIKGTSTLDQQKLIDWLQVGDIAVYRTPNTYAIHRIVAVGVDEQGKYFRFKGDNNTVKDAELVRGSQIEYISIGTIY